MNGKLKRDINYKVRELLVEWLKTLVTEEEAAKIDNTNYRELLPTQTHVFLNRRYRLSAFTERWIKQKIKKILSRNPTKSVQSITLKDLKEIANDHR